MKVKINHSAVITNKVRIETEDYIFDVSVCSVTKKLIINKIDGIKSGCIAVYPRYSNEIEIE